MKPWVLYALKTVIKIEPLFFKWVFKNYNNVCIYMYTQRSRIVFNKQKIEKSIRPCQGFGALLLYFS